MSIQNSMCGEEYHMIKMSQCRALICNPVEGFCIKENVCRKILFLKTSETFEIRADQQKKSHLI